MEEIMVLLQEYWVFILPLLIIQLGLLLASLLHILKHDTYRTGSRVIWIIICVFVNIIGPVLYFTIGKGDE